MNRTIKEARVKCYHYGSHVQSIMHLHNFITPELRSPPQYPAWPASDE